MISIEYNVSSRARRVTQREFGINPYLIDERGRKFTVSEVNGPPFDRAVGPAESFITVRAYRIEPDSRTIDLIIRGGGGIEPGMFVIGDQASLLHARTVVRIKPAPGPV